ncbi:MAG: CHRD domain-containing protein [Rhodospirillaceae bacterium]|nr:CHRD domain-containing protein [Rhodospirillaceae bacterium]
MRNLFLTTAIVAAGLLNGQHWTVPAMAADDDIIFTAALSPDEQSIPTYSPATGFAEVRLERETLKITWKVTYKDATTPVIAAGLHGPENAGANAGQVVDLAPDGDFKSPIEGSQVLSDGVFQYLITGRMYVNLMTTKYKEGELRGQLRRQRAAPKQ